jgi:uncharacterized YigZ family protein
LEGKMGVKIDRQEVAFLPYKVLIGRGEGEIVEKRSRFLGVAVPVSGEDEVNGFLEERRKRYWDASHHVFAYVLGTKGEVVRCSDDGEPSGTGGRPVLDVLMGAEVRNALVVVTRYFGGTLLGTGGLARAYGAAALAALESGQTGSMVFGYEVSIRTDYNGLRRVQYILRQKGIEPSGVLYGENVDMTVEIAQGMAEGLRQELADATGGKLFWEQRQGQYFLQKSET